VVKRRPNPLSRLPTSRRVRRLAETPPGFRHRTPHFGVFSSSACYFTFRTLGNAMLSIALALFGCILAFICTQLAIVGRLLTIAGDVIPLVGDPVAFVGGPVAAVELVVPPHE
jgi:hypothetical protein